MPITDIEETEDAWIIEAELPGVDRKDVNVELRDSELIISGEIKENDRKASERRRCTRPTGRPAARLRAGGPIPVSAPSSECPACGTARSPGSSRHVSSNVGCRLRVAIGRTYRSPRRLTSGDRGLQPEMNLCPHG
jgi:HSP20 family protein